MSWGGGEFLGESSYDSYFKNKDIVYIAAAGDETEVSYPAASPDVVAAGGTTLRRNPDTGDFIEEVTWVYGGGGDSLYEWRPSYQSSISGIVGSHRGTPDMSMDADPYTGVWVCLFGGWGLVGGTSVSAPVLAGIVNQAGNFAASTNVELTTVYSSYTMDFNDITSGYCGFYMGVNATKGWDFCTGVGSPKTYAGK